MGLINILQKHGFLSAIRYIFYWMDWRKPNRECIRTFLREQIAEAFKRTDLPKFTGTQDEKMLKILTWVNKNIKYTPDSVKFNTPEKWATIEETLSDMRGDCEDGAILIVALSYINGVNPLQVEFVCGDVDGGGHAWVEYAPDEFYDYKTDKMNWYTIDWCYWYDTTPFKNRIKRSDRYINDWFRMSVIY
jgi:hypothetical protein